MKKSTLIISWSLYAIAFGIILFELLNKSGQTPSWSILSIGALLLSVPWLICLIHAIKKNHHPFWIFMLIISGFVAIPFYLIKLTRGYFHN
jgi:hypothetical protein